MKIVSISQDFFDLVEGDRELMLKHNRPCIVVVRLRFRGKRRDFAVPLRSNIAPNVPKDQYFALPPRPTTRPGCRHGIHYIKMFPITKAYQRRFRTEGSAYYVTLQRIIDGNTKRIVSECQAYLDLYEREGEASLRRRHRSHRWPAGRQEIGRLGSIPSHAEPLHFFERHTPQMPEKQAMRCGGALVPARSHLHQRLRCATTSRANRLTSRAF